MLLLINLPDNFFQVTSVDTMQYTWPYLLYKALHPDYEKGKNKGVIILINN